MDLTREEKLSHLVDLMALAKSDEEIYKIESVYIKKVAERLGVDELTLAQAETLGAEKAIPKSEAQIIPLFHRLLILMSIDRDVDHRELHFCKDLGIRMGLNPSAVNEIILLSSTGIPEYLDPDRINAIFKKYYN